MASFPSSIDTLLVDLDGTLVRMERRGLECRFMAKAILRFAGVIAPWSFRRVFWESIETMQRNRSERTNYEVLISELARRAECSELEIARRSHLVLSKDFPTLSDRFSPIPGAREFLDLALEKGLKLVLATNPVWPYDAVRRRMEWGGVADLPWEFISHSQTMTRCKPGVDYYRELLDRIERRPEQCLMIGNDARKDLPAREIGIETYILGTFDELSERLNPCLSA